MILNFESGEQIRGDLILRAELRSDLSPIPVTLQADVRTDSSVLAQLAEGKIITTGNGDRLRIICSKPTTGKAVQDGKIDAAVRVVAFLDDCAPAAFVRDRAIILAGQTLQTIYRAAGCALRPVAADFAVPRFVCLVGDTPTVHIARALQEAGGVVRWKHGRMQFFRLQDLMRQPPSITVPDVASDDVQSGFLERHEAAFFFSVAPDGSIVHGNRAKARIGRFAPHQDASSLQNMTRVLVRRKVTKVDYAANLAAGDLVDYAGNGAQAIITALHFYESGSNGGGHQSYTKLWCGSPM